MEDLSIESMTLEELRDLRKRCLKLIDRIDKRIVLCTLLKKMKGDGDVYL